MEIHESQLTPGRRALRFAAGFAGAVGLGFGAFVLLFVGMFVLMIGSLF